MKNGKDKNQENLPPSLFDNLDLFAASPQQEPESIEEEPKKA